MSKLSIYKCMECGNVVELLISGGGVMSCCGGKMVEMKENTTDAAVEKHVPIIEKTENGIKVKVGEVAHPMTDEHYIQWIEVIADGKAFMKLLNPGDLPEASFCCFDADNVTVRAYCNLHGLWKA